MKRVMSLIVVMVAILFSQSALAQIEFQVSEPVLTKVGEVQQQGVGAGGFKIVPLQAFTVPAGQVGPQAWWALDEEHWFRALFTVYGTGTYYTRVKVTDVKTGQFVRFPKTGPSNVSDGEWAIHSVLSVSGNPLYLPRQFILTYEFKVGTTWKAVSTKILLR